MNSGLGTNCPICSGPLTIALEHVRDADSGEEFRIVMCSNCGLGKTDPIPHDLGKYYSQEYYGNRHGFTRQICNRRRLGWINRQFPSLAQPRLLDFGCGDGSFLDAARRERWHVAGVERSPAVARSLGLNVAESLESVSEQFDCVTLWHVLEHIEDPTQVLQAIDRVLADGGSIFVAVPDFRSLQAKVFRRRWLHLDVPRHVLHFSEESLRRIFAQNGFVAQRLQTSELEYDLMGWVQSLLNMWSVRSNLLLQMLMHRPNKLSWLERFTHLVAGTILASIALVPTWLSGYLGKGGTIVIRAERCSPKGNTVQRSVD